MLNFLRERLKHLARPAWLINIYFIDDPIDPTGRTTWQAELEKVKAALGIPKPVPYAFDIFLPAVSAELGGCDDTDCADDVTESVTPNPSAGEEGETRRLSLPGLRQPTPPKLGEEGESFGAWADRWMLLASYPGEDVPDVADRIERLVEHWRQPIPGSWQRGVDPQLLGRRYRRGDVLAPHDGEHAIEHQILCEHFDEVSCLEGKLIDGVNALPLVRDSGGGRRANVEADLFLLTWCAGGYRLLLCEVKESANSAWFALVENLRQLRLFQGSVNQRHLFQQRNPTAGLMENMTTMALVIAPADFYRHAGKRFKAVAPANMLIARFRQEFGVEALLTVWDRLQRRIVPFC